MFRQRPLSNDLARELIAELRFARNHGSFALINARLSAIQTTVQGSVRMTRDALNQFKEEIITMAGETVEALKGAVERIAQNTGNIATEIGRGAGELREIAGKLGEVTDLNEIPAITERLNAQADSLQASAETMKAVVDEVDTDKTHPEPEVQG